MKIIGDQQSLDFANVWVMPGAEAVPTPRLHKLALPAVRDGISRMAARTGLDSLLEHDLAMNEKVCMFIQIDSSLKTVFQDHAFTRGANQDAKPMLDYVKTILSDFVKTNLEGLPASSSENEIRKSLPNAIEKTKFFMHSVHGISLGFSPLEKLETQGKLVNQLKQERSIHPSLLGLLEKIEKQTQQDIENLLGPKPVDPIMRGTQFPNP